MLVPSNIKEDEKHPGSPPWKWRRTSIWGCITISKSLLSEWSFLGRVSSGHFWSDPFMPHHSWVASGMYCGLLSAPALQQCRILSFSLQRHVALDDICKPMTLLSFHHKQNVLYKNNIQYWNDSINLTNWVRLSSWSKSLRKKKSKCKSSFCWWPNFMKYAFLLAKRCHHIWSHLGPVRVISTSESPVWTVVLWIINVDGICIRQLSITIMRYLSNAWRRKMSFDL